MVWYGMVWYGMVWYGMVLYGMVWYGMVWYGMVCINTIAIHVNTNHTYPKYRRRFQHFRHESGNTFKLTISRAHSSQYGVFDRDLRCFTWNKTSDLSHQHSDTYLKNDSFCEPVLLTLCWISNQNKSTKHTDRIYVDFPPMFGPVIIKKDCSSIK